MGITPDFLIKHIRPVGADAYDMICNDRRDHSLYSWLISQGVTEQEIANACGLWKSLSELEITDPANIQAYTNAALAISEARWSEYYATSASTILFLDAPQIKELSDSSTKQANKEF